MLSYQHGYHAGCFADVIKHLTLCHLLSYMTIKDTALLYLDTHSGRGLYDLTQKQSQKTGEFHLGIECLWNERRNLPKSFSQYLQILRNLNPNGELRYYPGSPEIALQLLRHKDRAVLCELHPKEFVHLEKLQSHGARVFPLHTNGIEQLKAMTPPIEKRGLIFIDPSFEVKQEYKTIIQPIQNAYKRFATGVYCIWYPIIDQKLHLPLLNGLAAISDKKLNIEFYVDPKQNHGMFGCGLWIINPPHTLANNMQEIGATLCKYINPGFSKFKNN